MNTLRRLLFFSGLLLSLPCLAVPVHYIVVREDANGQLTVTHRSIVEMADTPQLAPTAAWGGDGNRFERRLSARVFQSGKVEYQTDVAASRWLRGEFAAVDGMPAQANHITQAEYFYVLRIPTGAPGSRLLLERPQAASLPANSERAPGAESGQSPSLWIDLDAPPDPKANPKASASDVAPILQRGDPANRLDLLIIGDGYTAAQRAKFQTDALAAANGFLMISPYQDYANAINVSGLFLTSPQAGANKPDCAETPGEPVVTVNTILGATFCSFGIRRLVTINTATALAEASVAPNWDKIFVLVNDSEYGGSGGSVLVATTNESSIPILRHEFGHSFTMLADEYEFAFPGYPACTDATGSGTPCEVNVTDRTSPLKWAGWVTSGTPIPTLAALADPKAAGAWEGARYLSNGMFRQCFDGIMRSSSSQYFCRVDGEAFVKTLYGPGWGVPSGGVSNIEPGSASPASTAVNATTGSKVTLRADVLGPSTSPLNVTWTADGATVKSETVASGGTTTYDYTAIAGGHDVALAVKDATPILLVPRTSSRTWRVTGSGTGSNTPRLVNIATRGRVQTGANVMIAGFIIGGSTPKKVLITARGPSVAVLPSEVPLLMTDPKMTLYSGATPVATNDDWQTLVTPPSGSPVTLLPSSQIPTTQQPGNGKDAAILTTLAPGAYTAIVEGVGGATGLSIVEVFEVDNPDAPLLNIATRGRVEPGANVMIAGFIIQGDAPKSVLVTARGQSVAVLPSEVPLLMADPKMTLYSGATPIASNDDWQTLVAPPSGSPVTLLPSGNIPATQQPGNAKDAAILTTLAPGAYTAIVEGVGGASGIAIVEVFAQ